MHQMHKSRGLSRETGQFVRVTPGSQSLERGIRLLRAFLEGATNLSNSELAARTQLPKATVSRLSRSLVDAGLLEFDPTEEAYRLAPSCLSLGRAFQFSRTELGSVSGLLKTFARENQVNVGLSAPDQIHMVYLTTFREGRGAQTRTVAAGLRLLMATCSPGIAYLTQVSAHERARLFSMMEVHYGLDWPGMRAALNQKIRDTQMRGYSQASSIFGNAGVGTTALGPRGARYGINASYLASEGLPPSLTEEALGRKVIALAADVQSVWGRLFTVAGRPTRTA
jgi:IclR family transcriptional regulator, positive regulator for flagellar biogenesis